MDRHNFIQHPKRRMERAKDTDKDCLNRDSFEFCGKVIAVSKQTNAVVALGLSGMEWG
jgi:hypothetical protein